MYVHVQCTYVCLQVAESLDQYGVNHSISLNTSVEFGIGYSPDQRVRTTCKLRTVD